MCSPILKQQIWDKVSEFTKHKKTFSARDVVLALREEYPDHSIVHKEVTVETFIAFQDAFFPSGYVAQTVTSDIGTFVVYRWSWTAQLQVKSLIRKTKKEKPMIVLS